MDTNNFNLNADIKNALKVLAEQPGYVGIGADASGGPTIPESILKDIKFDDQGNSSQTQSGVFDFSTVTGKRRIEWKTEEGKDQHSYVLEGVTVTTGQGSFTTSVPFAAFQQMEAASNPNADFTFRQTPNKKNTRMYYSIRVSGLKATSSATAKGPSIPQVENAK